MFVNTAAVRLFGAAHAGSLLGKRTVDFVHPDSRDLGTERARRYKRGEEPDFTVLKYRRVDGSEFYGEVAGKAFSYRAQSRSMWWCATSASTAWRGCAG